MHEAAAEGPAPPFPKPLGSERLFIPLSSAESRLNDETAARLAINEHEMRRDLARGILRAFVVGNSAVWVLVVLLLAVDIIMIATGRQVPRDRVIDGSAVKVLVGATAAQVGLIMVTISTNLFPRRR
jgi:hypothetical protein